MQESGAVCKSGFFLNIDIIILKITKSPSFFDEGDLVIFNLNLITLQSCGFFVFKNICLSICLIAIAANARDFSRVI